MMHSVTSEMDLHCLYMSTVSDFQYRKAKQATTCQQVAELLCKDSTKSLNPCTLILAFILHFRIFKVHTHIALTVNGPIRLWNALAGLSLCCLHML